MSHIPNYKKASRSTHGYVKRSSLLLSPKTSIAFSIMSSQNYPLRQSGIYRNLPTFDPAIKDLTAIVCGATGISGFHAVRALLESPERWRTIYTVSRTPLSEKHLSLIPASLHERIKHVAVDFESPLEEIVQKLRNNIEHADYVFYYTYIQPKSEGMSGMDPRMAQTLCDANVPVFDTFLRAVEAAGLQPKRILLQTGGKNYGMHLGRVRTPLVESDPQPRHLQPNFYYLLEDLLKQFCARNLGTGWNVLRPAAVIGATLNSPLNTFYSFGMYAAVQAQKNEALEFGGDFDSWQFQAGHSTARLTGYLSEWAVLESSCANQAFNAQDGGGLSWDRFFEELARWFGAPGVTPPSTDSQYRNTLELAGGEDAPLGYGPPLILRNKVTMAEWAREAENQAVWEDIKAASGSIVPEASMSPEIMMGDFAYLNFGSLSMNKARRYGFSGFVDSLESIFESLQEMERFGILPSMKVKAARPLE